MLFRHLKEELEDAKAATWREEARLVSRNAIIAAAAALCPLGVIMAVLALVLWRSLSGMPDLMLNAAYLYPLSAIPCIGLAIWMHGRALYTGAMLVALAPFLWVPAFALSGLWWAFT